MKFEELYNLISEGRRFDIIKRGIDPTPTGAKKYNSSDLHNEYLKFDLGYSRDIAEIVYNFIRKTDNDNGYYTDGFRVIAYFYDHPLLPAQIGYNILTPRESKELGIADVFINDLWEYALKTNKDKWKSHFTGSVDMYADNWDCGFFKVRSTDKIYIWEFDPMDKYSTDKETKDTWRDVVSGL